MTVINEPTRHNTNKEVGYSNALMMDKIITEENKMSFRAMGRELDDEDTCCFVLGYN
ncbi:MAG: hypothetical protein ACJAXS_003421 [Colwellia sp.]|jgi:hypothetical protein